MAEAILLADPDVSVRAAAEGAFLTRPTPDGR